MLPKTKKLDGVFTITQFGGHRGTFKFITEDASGNKFPRTFVVESGDADSVRRAMVKKMAETIRRFYPGDFAFDSRRIGRLVKLSGRPEDSDEVEDFLLKEMFDKDGLPIQPQPQK